MAVHGLAELGLSVPGGGSAGSAEPQLGENFFRAALDRRAASQPELVLVWSWRFMDSPSWGSAFPGGKRRER